MNRTLNCILLAAGLAASSAVAVAPLRAQTATAPVSNTSGLLLGIGVNASTISAHDPEVVDGRRSGGGISLELGYGFTPHFVLYGAVTGATVGDHGDEIYANSKIGLAHVDLGGRVHFGGERSRVRPFLQAAVTARALTHDNVEYVDQLGESRADMLSYTGAALTLGGGVDYFFSPRLALHSSVQASAGKFTDVTLGDMSTHGLDIKSTTGRLDLGLSWYPMGYR